jgi:hypothetical protein
MDKTPLYNYLLSKMQSYPFDWNWDSFTVANTTATTLIVIIFSASFTRAFLLRILRFPRNFLYGLQGIFDRDESHDSEEREYNEGEEEEEEGKVWQDEGNNMFLRLRYMVRDRLPYLPTDVLSSSFEWLQRMSGRLMLVDVDDEDAFQNSQTKRDSNASRLRKIAGFPERYNATSKGQLPNIALPPPPEISKGVTVNEISSNNVSFDPNIEPAFLNDEDYPDDWMVYDPVQGKVVSRKELNVGIRKELNVEKLLKPQAVGAQ